MGNRNVSEVDETGLGNKDREWQLKVEVERQG